MHAYTFHAVKFLGLVRKLYLFHIIMLITQTIAQILIFMENGYLFSNKALHDLGLK